MLLVAQALASGAIEDPVLLPFVEMEQSLDEQDRASGDADKKSPRIVEPRDRAVLGEHGDGDGEKNDGDLRELVGSLIRRGLAVIPVDLGLQPRP
jgi:hypothetical protein